MSISGDGVNDGGHTLLQRVRRVGSCGGYLYLAVRNRRPSGAVVLHRRDATPRWEGALLRIGVHYGSSTAFASVLDDVAAYDRAGVDAVWLGESYGFDAVSALGALTARTERLEIGAAILPVQTRTPTLIAMTAAGLDALSNGRFHLGLGVSGPQVVEGFHDAAFGPPLDRTRHVVDACRAIWRREPIVSDRLQADGAPYRPLKIMQHPARSTIPISIAAVGDRNVALAAEIADGWFPVFFWPERHEQVWGAPLAAGRAHRSPTLAPLAITVDVTVALGAQAGRVLDRHRANLAHYIGGMGTRHTNFYTRLLARYGYPDEARRIQDHYLAGRKDEAAALVPDELVHGTALSGSTQDVTERLRAYAAAGVTTVNLNPQGTTLEARLEQLALLTTIVRSL